MPDLPKRMDQFARMRAVRDSTLDSREKLVLIMWVTFADGNDGAAWPSIARLAKATSLGKSTVRESLRELERLGWLVLVGSRKGGRMSNRYRFQVPNPPDGGGLNPTLSGPQPDAQEPPTRQSVAPSPPHSVAEQTNQQIKEPTTQQHTADAEALLALGVGEEWLRHANATPERVAWLVREAKRKASPAGFVVAAIRDAYEVPKQRASDDGPASASKLAAGPFDSMNADERAQWVTFARRRFRHLASASEYADDSPHIRVAVNKLVAECQKQSPKGSTENHK
jgi:hypothetical protein